MCNTSNGVSLGDITIIIINCMVLTSNINGIEVVETTTLETIHTICESWKTFNAQPVVFAVAIRAETHVG